MLNNSIYFGNSNYNNIEAVKPKTNQVDYSSVINSSLEVIPNIDTIEEKKTRSK